MATSTHVRVNGVLMHVETLGGDGQPVLFVHGFPLSGEMWLPAAEILPGVRGADWRLIIPDLRGHGRSEARPDATIAQFADDLAGLLDALGERRPVVLCGLSMGGIIGFEFFRRYRSRLRGLVLVCTRANAESPEGIARREATAQTALRDGTRPVVDALIDSIFAPSAPAELKRRWYDVMCRTPPLGVAAAARALAARPDSFPTLPQIDVPTLVVAGERDAITPVETLRQIHEGIRGSRIVIVKNAGHLVPVEHPAEFARELSRIVTEIA